MLGQEGRKAFSGGLGYRGMQQTVLGRGIAGAYLFTDYYQTELNKDFWQLNPGLEWLNEHYEARLQGYVPVSHRNQAYRHTLASQIPVTVLQDSGKQNKLFTAAGHSFFDTPVALVEEIGPGVELEAGKFFDYGKGFWLRVGGYHFNYKDAININGVEANIEAVINEHASLLIQNNYDNQNKNRFAVGLRVSFGGSSAPIKTLEQRMTSPIIRHIARQSYGEAVPTRKSFVADGPAVMSNNIWFFSPNGAYPLGAATTLANCTAENPCLTIDSATAAQINVLAPDANLYFATGSYVIPKNPLNNNNWVNLQNGQSVYGRTTGWLNPATGANRPLINGALIWGTKAVVANGALYDMRVNNVNQVIPTDIIDFSTTAGFLTASVVSTGATGNLTVTDSDIQGSNTSSDNVSVVSLYSGQKAFINQTSIVATNTKNALGAGQQAVSYGIMSLNGVNMVGSTVNAQASGNADGSGTSAQAIGILNNNGDSSISSSSISVTASGNADNRGYNAVLGIVGGQNTTITGTTINALSTGNAGINGNTDAFAVLGDSVVINNSVINTETTGNALSLNSSARSTGASVTSLQINKSTVNVISHGKAANNSRTRATALSTSTDIAVTDSTINVLTTGTADGNGSIAEARGIQSGAGAATVLNSTINATTTGAVTNGGSNTVFGVQGATAVNLTNVTLNAQSKGSADGVGSNVQALGVRSIAGNTLINNSTIQVSSSGNTSNHGDGTVFAVYSKATITGSTINAHTTGNVTNSSFAQANGVRSDTTISLTNTTVSVQSSGNAISAGDATVFGVFANQNVNVVNSTIIAKTTGNADGVGSTTQSVGVFSGTSSIVTNSTVKSESSGLATNSGNVNVFGVQGGSSVLFQGSASSFISAITAHGTAFPTTGVVTNNSTPKSQCSTNGVTFTDC
ncbi:MAG: hypothetical protein P4L65_06275 [Legionella sp.]|nr:hypothetical protein [Legionella sp.]